MNMGIQAKVKQTNELLEKWALESPQFALQFIWPQGAPKSREQCDYQFPMIGFRAGIITKAMNDVFGAAGWKMRIVERPKGKVGKIGVEEEASVAVSLCDEEGNWTEEREQYGDDVFGGPKGHVTNAMCKALSLFGIGEASYCGLIDVEQYWSGSSVKFDWKTVKIGHLGDTPKDEDKPDTIDASEAAKPIELGPRVSDEELEKELRTKIADSFMPAAAKKAESYASHQQYKKILKGVAGVMMTDAIGRICDDLDIKYTTSRFSLITSEVMGLMNTDSDEILSLKNLTVEDLEAIWTARSEQVAKINGVA